MKDRIYNYNKMLLISFVLLLGITSKAAAGGVPTIPEIPAFLPTVDSVPATQAMPLDGTWLISSIGKKVRIESGRAFAIDGWLHLFTLKIAPGMVVIRNITPTAAGQYSGDDLPLLGKWNARVQANRSLAVSVAGVMGPVQYVMVPVQLDNAQWYAQEMEAAGYTVAPPAVQPDPPVYQPTPPPPSSQPAPPVYQPTPPIGDDGSEGEEDEPVVIEEDEQEVEQPTAAKKEVKAKDHGAYACKGKNLYYSKGSCYSCPKGYSRFSPTRKMTHDKACTKRQPGKNAYTKAKYVSEFSLSCAKSQFKHKGRCKSCPIGYVSKKTAPEVSTGARFHTGYCIAK